MSVEVDETGLCTSVRTFDPRDLRLAFVDCWTRVLDAVDTLTESERVLRSFGVAFNQHENIDHLVAVDFDLVDHRSLHLGGELDRDGFVALQVATAEDSPHWAMWSDAIRSETDVFYGRARRWSDPRDPEPTWEMLQVVEVREGTVCRVELFDLVQRADAEARFAALVARAPEGPAQMA